MVEYAFNKLAAANQNAVRPVDPFTEIYHLKNVRKLAEALDRVYDERRDDVRPPFDADPNHAWYVIADIYCRQQEFALAKKAFERALIECAGGRPRIMLLLRQQVPGAFYLVDVHSVHRLPGIIDHDDAVVVDRITPFGRMVRELIDRVTVFVHFDRVGEPIPHETTVGQLDGVAGERHATRRIAAIERIASGDEQCGDQ